jgi:hypothetical protein
MRTIKALSLLFVLGASPVSAQALMDLDAVDPAMLQDFMGDWSIQNGDASKVCKVTLTSEVTIGGLEIDVDPNCSKVFPVMKHVTSWRLYEDWQIVLVDAKKTPLILFSVPDNAYVAEPETDGITTIVKIGGSLEN